MSSCNNKTGGTRCLTVTALTLSTALILSYVEALMPPVSVPGVKLGLANAAVIFTLYSLGGKEAATVSVLRVILVGILFGNAASFIYSAAGAVLSLSAMLILKKTGRFSVVGVSVLGGVCHNIGQVIAAVVLLGIDEILMYLPVLIVSGIVSGTVIGILGGVVVSRVKV